MRRHTVLSTLLMCGALSSPAVRAADAPDALPSDLDALSLADQAPTEPKAVARPWRLFIEGNLRRTSIDDPDSRYESNRASIDGRIDATLAPGVRAVFSDRLDLRHSNRPGIEGDVNTVREAYLSWAPTDHQVIDLGRVNVRHGAAYGYNPTDWFKEGAVRSIVSLDPAVLRENRQGTVVLQGQQLWTGGSLTAAYSPNLGDQPNPGTFSLNVGATNPHHRWLLAGSTKFSDKLNAELLLFGGQSTREQLGLNLSGLVGDATVVFGEFSIGKGPSLITQSLNLHADSRYRSRAAVGLTYTTTFNLSLTAEAEYNEAGPTRRQWRALPSGDPLGQLRLLETSQTLQDLPARSAGFLYALWKDALVRRLDLSAFVRRENETRSRVQWLEARYHWDQVDLVAQWQQFSGSRQSIFGSVPQSRTIELAVRFYL
ncbi:MAG: hypothetical protein CFE40_02265 [Burkholderiales bacterium PBB1]|nr:MAG: hypothetical protein CFE40_02265 [Burkholderiales bacterium PBB1]